MLYQKTLPYRMGHVEKQNVISKNINLQARSCPKIECYIKKNINLQARSCPKIHVGVYSSSHSFQSFLLPVMLLRVSFMLALCGSFWFVCCTSICVRKHKTNLMFSKAQSNFSFYSDINNRMLGLYLEFSLRENKRFLYLAFSLIETKRLL